MLVTFHTKSYAKITFLGDVAVQLLRLMGQSGDVPGALAPDQIPDARRNLRTAVELKELSNEGPDSDDEDDRRAVSLAQRALPLLQLLDAAERDEAYVTWKEGRSLA